MAHARGGNALVRRKTTLASEVEMLERELCKILHIKTNKNNIEMFFSEEKVKFRIE